MQPCILVLLYYYTSLVLECMIIVYHSALAACLLLNHYCYGVSWVNIITFRFWVNICMQFMVHCIVFILLMNDTVNMLIYIYFVLCCVVHVWLTYITHSFNFTEKGELHDSVAKVLLVDFFCFCYSNCLSHQYGINILLINKKLTQINILCLYIKKTFV